MDQLELLVAQLMIGYKRIANPSFNESFYILISLSYLLLVLCEPRFHFFFF